MLRKMLNVFVLIQASLLTLALNYYKVSITTYQQILVILMIVALIVYNYYNSKKRIHKIPGAVVNFATLFISSFFVQLLVISTGSVFSPFLILFHLFSLAISFLISFEASLTFVILGFTTLGINIWLNPSQIQLIKEDPGTVLLYGVSFLVILPLAQIITKRYHIKDELSKVLSHQVEVGESVLESLNEIVLITDSNLKIISINEAARKFLDLAENEIVNKSLLDLLNLKDEENHPATLESLSINNVLEEHSSRIVGRFLLYSPNNVAPFKVSIQIRPIINNSGKVEQLSFVLHEGEEIIKKQDHNLEPAFANERIKIDTLKEQLEKAGLGKLDSQLELIAKTQEDINLLEEIEDHGIKESPNFYDVVPLTQEVINIKRNLAQSLGVTIKFRYDEDVREASLLDLQKTSSFNTNNLPISDFAAPLDLKWAKVLINKTIDLALLLSINNVNPQVEVFVNKSQIPPFVNINISSSYALPQNEHYFLFEKYYPNLASKKILSLASGLEGYIAKLIINQLKIPLVSKSYGAQTSFVISFSKGAR